MRVVNKILYLYNIKIRPNFNHDLAVVFKLSKEKYPFAPEADEIHLTNGLNWLIAANKAVGGRGLPSKFSIGMKYGLGQPYPEVTGYTLCTLLTTLRNEPLAGFDYSNIEKLIENCVDYLLEIQFLDGSFTGGSKGMANFGRPSVFNTGQILLGLVDAYETAINFPGKYLKNIESEILKNAIIKAGEFLNGEIDGDGAFKIRHAFLKSKRTYYARAAYGLMRAGSVLDRRDFIASAKKFFDYVLTRQEPSGWINGWGFEDKFAVLHTIAYTLRGLVEAFVYFNDERYSRAARKSLDFLLNYNKADFDYPDLLPSHYDKDGNFINDLCLTGLSQIAIVIKKYETAVGGREFDGLFADIVEATKKFQMRGFGNELLNGMMPASWPLASGRYKPYAFIEWGTKFFMDSILLKMGLDPREIKG